MAFRMWRLSLLLRGKDSDRRYSNPAIHYLVYCRGKKRFDIHVRSPPLQETRYIWEHRTKMQDQYIIYDYWSDLKETDTHTDEPCRFPSSFRETESQYTGHEALKTDRQRLTALG